MTSKRALVTLGGLGIAAVAAAGVYTFCLRKRHLRWGATDQEVSMTLPGDDIVDDPNWTSTRAITIEAGTQDIWPWLVQMGKGRGGLYSYDWLDIVFGVLDRSSSETILSEYQLLSAGDVIPIGKDDSEKDDFYVHIVQPNRALVIGANDPAFRDLVSWAMVLVPISEGKTRLLVRVTARIVMDLKGVVSYAVLDPAAFVMLRKQMLNVKRLAERTRRQRTAVNGRQQRREQCEVS